MKVKFDMIGIFVEDLSRPDGNLIGVGSDFWE